MPSLDPLLKLALETIALNKQAIIFAPSRASAEKTAEEISKLTSFNLPELEKEILHAASTPTKQCRRLSHCLKKGIAFHHAGLIQKQRELIEDEFRAGKIKIICATPTLCLSGDTEIWQPEGNTLVRDFKNSYLFALSPDNKVIVMKAQKVNKIKNSRKLIEVASVSGYSIKLTYNHQILVKRNGKKQLIAAAECKKGDRIATAGKLRLNKTVNPKVSNFVVNNELPIPDRELTEDDFYLIGSMLGDGHSGAETRNNEIIYKGSPTFTSGDLESIEEIERTAKSFDPFSKRIKRFGSISLVLSKRKWFREFLCKCGIEMGKDKYINPFLMQADLSLIRPLIRGLFDTDGYVGAGRNIGFSNISFQLIQDLQRLLLRFGIVSRVRKRPGRTIMIIRKLYQTKPLYELLIAHQGGIIAFNKLIGFNLKRKQVASDKLAQKMHHILYSHCQNCNYKIYSDLFSGRTKEQKEWGLKKREVTKLLGKNEELGSRDIQKTLGFLPRHSKGNRLNHHYELISKRRIRNRSKTEWFWRLNKIGQWIYDNILKQNKDLTTFFNLSQCPLCKEKLHSELRKNWRNSDFEGDIFWDYVRDVIVVQAEEDVYDVVLPDKPPNDHLFVANGFIVHNSAGLSMPAFRVIIKSLKRYSGEWGMDWIPVLEYLQMAGRAGRPEYEKFGEAITIAKDEREQDEIHGRYLLGVPEDIQSKLAVEPVLRTYLLSLISSGIIRDEKTMNEFFRNTFWAHQYEDMNKLESIMDKMLLLLEKWKFISITEQKDMFVTANSLHKNQGKQMRPTLVGKRVAELYLDPLTARHLLDCMDNHSQKTTSFSWLQAISHTLEMRPLLRTKKKEVELVEGELVKHYDVLLEPEPSAFDIDYPDFINSIKTTLFFRDWIDEKDEDFLMEKLDVAPGEIRVKTDVADWLLYAMQELMMVTTKEKDILKELSILRIRIQNGVREDVLPLLKLKGIGRVRARRLVTQGLKDLGDLKKVDLTTLSQILGKAIAEDVKKQLGEEVEEVPDGKRKGQLSVMKFE